MDIIIGGGITGLSYAMFCGHSNYQIIEADSQIGGYCKTTKRNGFVWDYSGHFFHFRDKNIEQLIMSGIPADQLVSVAKKTSIKYKDLLIDYPFQKNIHQLPQEEFIDCLYDLFDIKDFSYNTFKEMLYAKFGKSISEKFLIPYNTKLYACDLDHLDKNAMGRFFPFAEKEEIIKNFKSLADNSYNSHFVYPKGGAIEYVNSIASHLDKRNISLNKSIVSINKEEKFVVCSDGDIIKYDKLISTIPFPKLLDLSKVEYDKTIYNWNKVLVFNLGFDTKGQDKLNQWIYCPEDKYCFYRVGYYDNIISNDKMSLYVEIGFDKNQEVTPNAWVGKVLSDLKLGGFIDENQVLVDYEALVMDPAYVHITEKSIIDVEEKKKSLADFDIYSIGRYGSWTYCSIEDNILEAKACCNPIER